MNHCREFRGREMIANNLVVIAWHQCTTTHDLWLVTDSEGLKELHDYYQKTYGYIPLFTILKGTP